MHDTIEKVYKRYLVECEKHIIWLKERKATRFRRFIYNLGTTHQNCNFKWVRALELIEIALGLTEKEKRSHKLEDYVNEK